MKFEELNEKESQEVSKNVLPESKGRILTLSEATLSVSKQIAIATESDKYGPESIIPKPGYKVYRFKKLSLMVFSMNASEWKMGALAHFGAEGFDRESRMVINRYLSWALAPLGFVGFFGVPVEEGMVIMKAVESNGEAIFLNAVQRKLLSIDGATSVKNDFQILRLDNALKGKQLLMKSEELYSFLSLNTSYFDYEGLSIPVRQMIQEISRKVQGIVYPRESFQPRTDLSL